MLEMAVHTDTVVHKRTVYSVVDLITEVGGLTFGLMVIVHTLLFLLGLFMNNPLTVHLTSALFIDSN